MPAATPMAAASRRFSSRKLTFLGLQALVAATGVAFVYRGIAEFLVAASGDPTPLFVAAILFMLASALFYSAIGLRNRSSTPFFTTLSATLFALLILASLSTREPGNLVAIALGIAVIVLLALMRNRFQLRPGQFVKEEKLPEDVAAKVSTKMRGVRCRECGDDDVWITSDKLLVCKNCGSTAA